LEIVGLSLGLAAAAWWILDGTDSRRQAVLLGDSLVVGGDMGKYSRPTEYKLSQIASAAIVHPEESKWPQTALFFHYEGREQAIGIESKASLSKLAQAIHDCGIPIRLDGWQPNQESEFEKAFSWQAGPGQAAEKARMETLPPGSPALVTPGGIVLAIVRQCWALALWLLIAAAAVYYGYRHWNDLGVVQVVLLIGLPIGTLWIATELTERFATAATSQGLVRTAKEQVRNRAGLAMNPDAELIPVEILKRDQFDKSIQKIHEVGFLQVDERGRRVLFEGQKERWSILAGSIQSLAIEEVQVGTPGQSATGSLHYFVVIRFATDQQQELGIRHSERDYGKFDDIKRAEGAIRVFEAIEPILAAG